MKHPFVKLFFARLRALAAVGRAAFPLAGLPAFLTPFARHAVRIERAPDGAFLVIEAGEAVETLFGRPLVGQPFTDLFRQEDRARVAAMLAAIASDRIACIFAAEAKLSRFRASLRSAKIEAMIAPEPDAPGRASACIASIGFPRGWGRRPLPLLAFRSKRFVDLDGLSGGAIGRQGLSLRRKPTRSA